MGKKGGGGGVGYGSNKKPPPTSGLLHHGKSQAAPLRQQSGRGGAAAAASSQALNPSNQAAALRADHLLRIATWASANVPPLGALLGARLGTLCEAAGVPVPDSPHSICERSVS